MKLQTSSSIENNTAMAVSSFSLSDTPHIYKLMYSSMYQNKEEAVIRELVANGQDGHAKIGKTDVPVTIHLPTQDVPELIVSDEGIGMSLEEVTSIYPVYGASTKRDTNDDIGGFGYGAKSPFAISESFTVKTTKDGVTTHMSCFLDEGIPKFVVFNTTKTGAPSGTVVSVPVTDTLIQQRLINATKTMFNFFKVKPTVINGPKDFSYPDLGPSFNYDADYNIVSNKAVDIPIYSTSDNYIVVTVGPFLYRLPKNIKNTLQDKNQVDAALLKELLGREEILVLSFGIGDLELAPSREVIEDTTANTKTILGKISLVVKQMKSVLYEAEKAVPALYDYVDNNAVFSADILSDNDPDRVSNPIVYIEPEKFKTFLKNNVVKSLDPFSLRFAQKVYFSNTTLLKHLLMSGVRVGCDQRQRTDYECIEAGSPEEATTLVDNADAAGVGINVSYRNNLYAISIHNVETLLNPFALNLQKHTQLYFKCVGAQCIHTTRSGGWKRGNYIPSAYFAKESELYFFNSPRTDKLKNYCALNNISPDQVLISDLVDEYPLSYLKNNPERFMFEKPPVIVTDDDLEGAWKQRPKRVVTRAAVTAKKASFNMDEKVTCYSVNEGVITSDDALKTVGTYEQVFQTEYEIFGQEFCKIAKELEELPNILIVHVPKTSKKLKKVQGLLEQLSSNAKAYKEFTYDATPYYQAQKYVISNKNMRDNLIKAIVYVSMHYHTPRYIDSFIDLKEPTEIYKTLVRHTLNSHVEGKFVLPLKLQLLVEGARRCNVSTSDFVSLLTSQEVKEVKKVIKEFHKTVTDKITVLINKQQETQNDSTH